MQMIRGDISNNTLLGLISKACTFPHLAETHAQLIRNGYQHDLATVTKLAQKLLDVGATRHARALFFSVPKPDIFLFNVLMKGFYFFSDASSISLYTHLRKNTTLSADNFTYVFAIKASPPPPPPDDNLGMCLHAHAVVDEFDSNLSVASALIDLYCKFLRVGYVRKVFDKMPERDTVLWNTMITRLVRNCCYDNSVQVFKDMVARRVRLDSTTVAMVLLSVAEMQEVKVGMGIQCLALKLEFIRRMPVEPGPAVWGTLLGACMIHQRLKLGPCGFRKAI